jgi:hypothetical protein
MQYLYLLFPDIFFFFSGSKQYLKVIIFLPEKRGIADNVKHFELGKMPKRHFKT